MSDQAVVTLFILLIRRAVVSDLQLRGGIEDNSKIFFISQQKHML